MAVTVLPFPLAHAGDAAGLRAALRHDAVAAARDAVILAKVPGPATLNDSARELAQTVFAAALHEAGGPALAARTRMLLSVGCEGIAASGGWLLLEDGRRGDGPARLCLGVARTPPIPVASRGGPAHVAAAAAAAAEAIRAAGLTPGTVRLVLVKSPVRPDQPEATGRSRAAAALGVAIALGEAPPEPGPEHHATRCMAMSGTETEAAEIVVLGNRPGAGGDHVVDSRLLEDLLDVRGIRHLLRSLGASFDADGMLEGAPPFVLLKAGLRPDGLLRGRPTHAIGTDMPADKHLRAAASGLLAAILGPTPAFVSGGAERQGSPGACLVAAIARAQ